MSEFLKILLSIAISIVISVQPANAARNTNSYDGNIFPIYAGNGSLVPPPVSISEALEAQRTSVIIYYLDDSSDSKSFAPVVSALKLIWGPSIDLIPLTTDSVQGNASSDPKEPSHYWHGMIPQIVVLNGSGEVFLDQEGQVPLEKINEAISKATGLEPPKDTFTIKSFNEYSSEPLKEGYLRPRQNIS